MSDMGENGGGGSGSGNFSLNDFLAADSIARSDMTPGFLPGPSALMPNASGVAQYLGDVVVGLGMGNALAYTGASLAASPLAAVIAATATLVGYGYDALWDGTISDLQSQAQVAAAGNFDLQPGMMDPTTGMGYW